MTIIYPLQPQNTAPPTPPRERFGRISPGLQRIDGILKVVQKSRTQEMIIEDIVGYGILRSAMDYIRPWVYRWGGHNDPSTLKEGAKTSGNLPAARERFIRELGSIATDCFAPGLIGAGVAHYIAKKGQNPLSATIIGDDTLRLFQELSKNAPNQTAFITAMAKELSKQQPQQATAISKLLQQSLKSPQAQAELAVQIAQKLKQQQLDVRLKQRWFNLQTLLGDTHDFIGTLPQHNKGKAFGQAAQRALGKALSASPWKIGAAIGGGLALTFSVPYINLLLTRHLDGLASYPAEMGLRRPVTAKEHDDKNNVSFSYVLRQAKNGHYLPLLTSLIPLTVVAGMVDTVKLSSGQWRTAFANPFKKGFKGFIEHQTRLNQFSKSFPYTSQQQIAALYGALITSRLLFSRSDIEFRERLVDSVFLGWMIWILGTPFLKRTLAQAVDKAAGTKLMKQVGNARVIKSQLEVERLLPKATGRLARIQGKTLASLIKINAGSIVATLILLGIIEPLVAMKWSMWQAKSRPQA